MVNMDKGHFVTQPDHHDSMAKLNVYMSDFVGLTPILTVDKFR